MICWSVIHIGKVLLAPGQIQTVEIYQIIIIISRPYQKQYFSSASHYTENMSMSSLPFFDVISCLT